jgi:hypothetical protein
MNIAFEVAIKPSGLGTAKKNYSIENEHIGFISDLM